MIQELLKYLIMPFTFCMIFLVIGLIFLSLKKNRIGWIITLSGVLLLYFFGSWSGSTLLMSPLEREYSPLLNPWESPELVADPSPIIVVLGSGHFTSNDYPITSQIGSISLIRVMEGLRLHYSLPGSNLVLMGGMIHRDLYSSDITMELMESTGIVPDSVRTLEGGLNTEEETLLVRELMLTHPQKPLILVTSASHMKRAMLLFNKAELDPVAAPTNFSIMGDPETLSDYFLWDVGKLSISHSAIYEYVGMAWAKVRGRI